MSSTTRPENVFIRFDLKLKEGMYRSQMVNRNPKIYSYCTRPEKSLHGRVGGPFFNDTNATYIIENVLSWRQKDVSMMMTSYHQKSNQWQG